MLPGLEEEPGEPGRTFGVDADEPGVLGRELDDAVDGVAVLTFGVVFLPRSFPAFRTVDALDWSVERTAAAVSLTFWPVDSEAVAAFSALFRAVLMASSAFSIATWPKTPALWDDAPMFSFPPTPSRIWEPRPEKRLPTLSTASGSMLVPLPGAMPPALEPPGLGVLLEPLP